MNPALPEENFSAERAMASRRPRWISILSWTAQVVIAVIFAQTLYFKFTFAPETQFIFAKMGGRPAATLVGFVELTCVFLLLYPRTSVMGAVLSLKTIMGALFTHLFIIGIEVINPETGESDSGLLFALACTVTICSLIVLGCHWEVVRKKYLLLLFPDKPTTQVGNHSAVSMGTTSSVGE